MSEQSSIRCMLMRGGTSRGPFFLASDLPQDPAARDQALLRIMGSGHLLQIDGIGGGNPLSSKVAIVSRSEHLGADVDYLFAQVGVADPLVDTQPNCGNMLAAVGPFALENGLVPAQCGETLIRIFNVNTGKIVEAMVQTPRGKVRYDGDARIDGVPGRAAPIRIRFVDAAGAKTGKLLPTGSVREKIDGIELSCIDMAVPAVFARADAFGFTGREAPETMDADKGFLARLETIRLEAGRRMGLGDVQRSVIPKPILVAPPAKGGDVLARYFMPWSCHKAFAATGAVCTAAAAVLPGSVVAEVARTTPGAEADFTIEHPQGAMTVTIRRDAGGAVSSVALLRTARLLFSGHVHYEPLDDDGAALSLET